MSAMIVDKLARNIETMRMHGPAGAFDIVPRSFILPHGTMKSVNM